MLSVLYRQSGASRPSSPVQASVVVHAEGPRMRPFGLLNGLDGETVVVHQPMECGREYTRRWALSNGIVELPAESARFLRFVQYVGLVTLDGDPGHCQSVHAPEQYVAPTMLLGPANGWVRETWHMGKRAMESETRHKCVTQEREFMSTTRPLEMSPLKLSRQSTRGANSKFGLRLLGKHAL
jgi:hypothetical protein